MIARFLKWLLKKIEGADVVKTERVQSGPFTIDTDLRTKSPLSVYDIDNVFKRHKSPLSGIGMAVIAASRKYNINATYIVAHAIHETGWGRSNICRTKNNLFGWSAFDASPYESAKAFPSKAACIDFVMGRINALYLTKGGKLYKGANLRGMNFYDGEGIDYAKDANWDEQIAKIGRAFEQEAITIRKEKETQNGAA